MASADSARSFQSFSAADAPSWLLFGFSTAAVLAAVAFGSAAIGHQLPTRLLVLFGTGAVAAYLFPGWARGIAVVVGAAALVLLNPVFSLYFLALLTTLAVLRRRVVAFVVVLVLGAIVYPKMAFLLRYNNPGFWNWINEPSLALLLFVSALWGRWRRDAGNANDPDTFSFLLLYLFPTHAANPMVLGPKVLWSPRAMDLPGITRHIGWFLLKVAALWMLRRMLPLPFLRDQSGAAALALSRPALWLVVSASYVETYLSLAATADVPILIARAYGWPLANPFRAALLAWNPVELWRRWGIYNRQFLLRVVYFPLGGNQRHRYLNILVTFLASALLLHSGWFGSKYWVVGTGGLRDQILYFLLQGLAVCGCLRLWQTLGHGQAKVGTGKGQGEGGFRWSPGRLGATLATQAYSALVHVIVLAQAMDLQSRLRVVQRCLGW